MHLVMFDIDGTLTGSFEYDKECFLSALLDVLETEEIDSDWSNYSHVSSTGIAMEAIERHTGRRASDEEIRKIESHLMFHLSQRFKERRDEFLVITSLELVIYYIGSKKTEPCICMIITLMLTPFSIH